MTLFWWRLVAWWKSSPSVAWVKKNWHWIVLPVGVLLVVLRLFRRGPPAVVAGEVAGAADTQLKATVTYTEKVEAATHQREADVAKIEEGYAKSVQEAVQADAAKVTELQASPEKTTDFLHGVGAQMRGQPPAKPPKKG